MKTHIICPICESRIIPGKFDAKMVNGVMHHAICYSMLLTSLECDIEEALRSSPEKFTRLANGNWCENEDLEKLKVERELFHDTIWGGALQDPSYCADLNVRLR